MYSQHSPSKNSSDNNLLPASDQTPPVEPSEENLLNSEVSNIQAQDVKVEFPAAARDNIPATISSVDQIGISAVDLDISKAVEKGIADSKKAGPLSPVKEVGNGGSDVSKNTDTESMCCESMGEKEKEADAAKEEATDVVAKKVSGDVQKGNYILNFLIFVKKIFIHQTYVFYCHILCILFALRNIILTIIGRHWGGGKSGGHLPIISKTL